MPDHLSPQQRHANMAAIHAKDTKPEVMVRKYLWHQGFRYRLNHRRLPGKPDIVLLRYHTCIFVNGCFWHGHNVAVDGPDADIANSECCKIPTTNRPFWVAKIRRNRQRDEEVRKKLADMGWFCITVWECDLKPQRREQTLQALVYSLSRIMLRLHAKPTALRPEEEHLTMAAEEETEYRR